MRMLLYIIMSLCQSELLLNGIIILFYVECQTRQKATIVYM